MGFIVFIVSVFISIFTTMVMYATIFIQLPIVFNEYEGNSTLLKYTLLLIVIHSIIPIISIILICGAWSTYAVSLIIGYFIAPAIMCFYQTESLKYDVRVRFNTILNQKK